MGKSESASSAVRCSGGLQIPQTLAAFDSLALQKRADVLVSARNASPSLLSVLLLCTCFLPPHRHPISRLLILPRHYTIDTMAERVIVVGAGCTLSSTPRFLLTAGLLTRIHSVWLERRSQHLPRRWQCPAARQEQCVVAFHSLTNPIS